MPAPATYGAVRYGYGFRPGTPAPVDAGALLAEARTGAGLITQITAREDRLAAISSLRDARRAGAPVETLRKHRRTLRAMVADDIAARIAQRAHAPHGFFERLAAFWADHFAVAVRNPAQGVMVPLFEVEALRPNLMGPFSALLRAAVQHPAMLVYLDQTQSTGPGSRIGQRRGRGLNENLAREVLELHTLGAGGPYTQDDVRAFAELLTGYTIAADTRQFRFRPGMAEPGAETVLGKRYGTGRARAADAEALLDDLARHPATARHMALKLATHFVADQPEPGLVTAIDTAWRASGGDLPSVYAAILDHPAAWSGFGAKIRRPVELVAAVMRASGQMPAKGREARRLTAALRAMNQTPFRPPGPDGWPEAAEAWITPQGLAARLDFAAGAGERLATLPLDPRAFADEALGDTLRPETRFAITGAPERWEGFALAIASPEFNRR